MYRKADARARSRRSARGAVLDVCVAITPVEPQGQACECEQCGGGGGEREGYVAAARAAPGGGGEGADERCDAALGKALKAAGCWRDRGLIVDCFCDEVWASSRAMHARELNFLGLHQDGIRLPARPRFLSSM